MNNQNFHKLISIVVVLFLSLLQVAAQEKAEGENYSAILEVARGPARAPLDTINRVYIYIDRFSSDEDVAQLVGLLKEKGTKALQEAIYKRNDGRISFSLYPDTTICVAWVVQRGDPKVIRLIIAHNFQLQPGFADSLDAKEYPYGIIELHVNDEGKGEGTANVFSKIRYDDKTGHMVVESRGQDSGVLHFRNVQRMK